MPSPDLPLAEFMRDLRAAISSAEFEAHFAERAARKRPDREISLNKCSGHLGRGLALIDAAIAGAANSNNGASK